MPTRDHYMAVARQIAQYLDAFKLGFKTYKVAELDEMLKTVAGDGARASGGGDTSDQLENALLQRGFLLYPPIGDTDDGFVRVIRSNTIIGNVLNALRYPGADGDNTLAGLLVKMKSRRFADDLDPLDSGPQV